MKPVKLSKHLLSDLRTLIADARQDVARRVNSALVLLYWKVGQRIRQDILKEKRAGYGEEIVHALSAQLQIEFGKDFTKRNIFNMIRFVAVFSRVIPGTYPSIDTALERAQLFRQEGLDCSAWTKL